MEEKLKMAETYVYTAEEIQEMVKSKKALRKAPSNLTEEIITLKSRIISAKELGDEVKLKLMEEKLQKMEELRAAQHAMTMKARTSHAIAGKVNKKNRQHNIAQLEKAELDSKNVVVKRRETRPTSLSWTASEEKKEEEEVEKEVKVEDTEMVESGM